MGLRRVPIWVRLMLAVVLSLVVFAATAGIVVERTIASLVTAQAARRVAIAQQLLAADVAALGTPHLVRGELYFGSRAAASQVGLVDRLQRLTGADATIFVVRDGTPIRVVTTIRSPQTGARISGTPLVGPARVALDAGGSFDGVSPIGGRDSLNSYEPLRDRTGALVGATFSGVRLTTLERAIAGIENGLASAFVLALAFAAVLFALVTSPLRRALQRLTAFARRLGRGDVDADVLLVDDGEFAEVAHAFAAMAEHQRRTAAVAARIADGDYDVEIEPASEVDVLGRSLRAMLDHLRVAVADLESLASTDALTRLGNRRAYEVDALAAAAAAHRRHECMALAIVDVDDFKRVNDTRGHQYGDIVLTRLGAALRTMRADDRAYRLGGDEFAVIFRNTDAEEAATVMRRVVDVARATLLGSTISVGVASAYGIGVDQGLLYRRADAALYLCKRGGRDGVVVAEAQATIAPA